MLVDFNNSSQQASRCSNHPQTHHQQVPSKQTQQHTTMSSAYHTTGDDCAINELLEGRMDLDVLMPDGRQVRLTVERRTPMMDLLVQAASATKISPGGHVIHVFGDGNKGSGTLQYKPSTPIGSLDTNIISIVPKKDASDLQTKRASKPAIRPFEPTFRVQVHLPRNQLTVLRVSPRVKISELKNMVCKEKGLDINRYQLVRPSGPTEPLAGDMTLGEYGSTEITLLSNSSIESHICNSTSHIISYPKRSEDQKRKYGILRLLAEDANKNVSNSSSACCVDGNQRSNNFSVPNEINTHQTRYKPKKRRPAPPPPPPILPEAPSHSRQSSSDSSGYHEATSSFLHEEHSGEEKASSDSSGVSSLDAKTPAVSSNSPLNNLKKKKAPAPPPPAKKKETLTSQVLAREHIETESLIKPEPVLQNSSVTPQNQPNNETQQKICLQQSCQQEGSSDLPQDSSLLEKLPLHPQDATLINQNIKNSYVYAIPVLENNESVSRNCKSSKYTAPQKNPASEINKTTMKNDALVHKVNPLQKNNPIQIDRVLVTGTIASENNVVEKDKVPRLDSKETQETGCQSQASVCVPTTSMSSASLAKDNSNEINLQKSSVKEQPENSIQEAVQSCKRETESSVKEDSSPKKSEDASTRVALVALNARLEQDVTQQEIASSIQAAFQAIDCSPQPTLLSIKQRRDDGSTSYFSQNSATSQSGSPQENFQSISSNATTVRVSLNENPGVSVPVAESSEKEALLIDEEPPPRLTSTGSTPNKTLRRSSSLLNFSEASPKSNFTKNSKRVRHLQRSLSDLSSDGKEDFEAEQERLQQEYIKLQRQFILWQQQLMSNHVMLREECIVPQYARTLRQSHSLPEGEDYSEETTPSVPLVSRSLSYEPTNERYSTLPRSAINIPSFEFNSVQVSNGTSTLRSSKTKSYFKPPQVRASTKSRQRLPPEIKKEGDLDISDDTKILAAILPSFESLKLITENNDEDVQSCISRLRDTTRVSQEIKKASSAHQPSTFTKPKSQLNNGDRVADKDLNCANGDIGQSKLPITCSKITEPQVSSKPPPPPPVPVSNGFPGKENCIKSTGRQNGVSGKNSLHNVDPREQLMLEIRKFGGRTALRKISLAS